ncbi:MAG: bifunctional oligoribonuclease/PAP phosphatase NrnA [Bacteroidia bacterium]
MIPRFNKQGLARVKTLLSTPKKIAIITHHKPDGDAMGSSLGLYNYLIQKKHKVQVVSPSRYPEFLFWMHGNNKVINYDDSPGKCSDALLNSEVIFCLDFNSPDRVEKLKPVLLNSKAVKILMDHHLTPRKFCDIVFSFPESCATSEIVYHFIKQTGGEKLINEAIAECLYAGIMTDTGSFRYSSMTPDTHRVIANLVETGISNHKIHELIYDNFSENRMRFLGYCIKEKLTVLPGFHTAYIAVTRNELKRFNHQPGDTEGVVNYGLGIKGINMAVFFYEQDDQVKISFRSHDDFSVKEIAEKYFDGGGHLNAAGGKSRDNLEDTIKKFLSILPKYKKLLSK